jgi:hypothetical protein
MCIFNQFPAGQRIGIAAVFVDMGDPLIKAVKKRTAGENRIRSVPWGRQL